MIIKVEYFDRQRSTYLLCSDDDLTHQARANSLWWGSPERHRREGSLLHLTHQQRSALSFRHHFHAMSSIVRPLKAFYDTFGIASIQETGRNAYIIIFARSLRMFAYGTNNLILGEIAALERLQK